MDMFLLVLSKAKAFYLDILMFVSLQNVFLISGSPSGVIGWSWEMVNTNQKIPIVCCQIFSSFVTEYLICTNSFGKSESIHGNI